MNTQTFTNDFSPFIVDYDQTERSLVGLKRTNRDDSLEFQNQNWKRPRLDSLSPESDGSGTYSSGTICPHVKGHYFSNYSTEQKPYEYTRPQLEELTHGFQQISTPYGGFMGLTQQMRSPVKEMGNRLSFAQSDTNSEEVPAQIRKRDRKVVSEQPLLVKNKSISQIPHGSVVLAEGFLEPPADLGFPQQQLSEKFGQRNSQKLNLTIDQPVGFQQEASMITSWDFTSSLGTYVQQPSFMVHAQDPLQQFITQTNYRTEYCSDYHSIRGCQFGDFHDKFHVDGYQGSVPPKYVLDPIIEESKKQNLFEQIQRLAPREANNASRKSLQQLENFQHRFNDRQVRRMEHKLQEKEKPRIIKSLLAYKFEESKEEEHEGQESTQKPSCIVCLEEFIQGELVKKMPCDGQHVFHKECIDSWLQQKLQCPSCRHPLSNTA